MKTVAIFFRKYTRGDSKWYELLRFAIIGVLATIVHYGAYLLLLSVSSINGAWSIGYVLSFCLNFILTTYFTFRTKPSVKNGLGFAISHAVNYTLQIALLNLLIANGVSKQLAPVLVFAIVVPLNFFLLRLFFKSKKA